jgi:hypothetical protein
MAHNKTCERVVVVVAAAAAATTTVIESLNQIG